MIFKMRNFKLTICIYTCLCRSHPYEFITFGFCIRFPISLTRVIHVMSILYNIYIEQGRNFLSISSFSVTRRSTDGSMEHNSV